MEKSAHFGPLAQSLAAGLKSSSSLWEAACSKSSKLSQHLASSATAFGEFIDAIQAISDNANTGEGATRDVGATLTRFCLRQRRLQSKLQALASALVEQFSASLGRRSLQWKQRVAEIEKRSRKRQHKQRGNAKGVSADDIPAERSNCEELLLERRQQCVSFLSLLLQLTNLEVDLLDEGEQLTQLRDSMETIIGGDEPRRLVNLLLDDICAADVSHHSTYSSNGEDFLRKHSQPSAAPIPSFGSTLFTELDGTPIECQFRHGAYNAFPTEKASTVGVAAGHRVVDSRRAPIPSKLSNHPLFVPPRIPASESMMVRPHDGQYSLPSRISHNGRPPIPPSPRLRMPPSPSHHHHGFPLCHSIATPAQVCNPQPLSRRVDNSHVGWGTLPHRTTLSCSVNDLRQPEINYRPQSLAPAPGRQRVVNSRPLSLTEECSHRRAPLRAPILPDERCDADSRASSSALIAETLEQIDKLGDELDSFCRTLKPIGRAAKATENSSSGVCSSTASLETAPPNFHNPQQHSSPSGTIVRYRPSYIQLPPPIPERRTSTITAATPTAPSIAELRGSVSEIDEQYLVHRNGADECNVRRY